MKTNTPTPCVSHERLEIAKDNKPKDVQKAWLSITNLLEDDKLKITLEVNGEWQQELFNDCVRVSEKRVLSDFNLTWLIENSYELAEAKYKLHLIESEVSSRIAETKRRMDELEKEGIEVTSHVYSKGFLAGFEVIKAILTKESL